MFRLNLCVASILFLLTGNFLYDKGQIMVGPVSKEFLASDWPSKYFSIITKRISDHMFLFCISNVLQPQNVYKKNVGDELDNHTYQSLK